MGASRLEMGGAGVAARSPPSSVFLEEIPAMQLGRCLHKTLVGCLGADEFA